MDDLTLWQQQQQDLERQKLVSAMAAGTLSCSYMCVLSLLVGILIVILCEALSGKAKEITAPLQGFR